MGVLFSVWGLIVTKGKMQTRKNEVCLLKERGAACGPEQMEKYTDLALRSHGLSKREGTALGPSHLQNVLEET